MTEFIEGGKAGLIARFTEPPRSTILHVLYIAAYIILFFALPAFAMLRAKGLLLWSFFITLLAMRHMRIAERYQYTLTETHLYRHTAGSDAPVLSLALNIIRSVRMQGSYANVRIPKKTYLIYTGTAHEPFIDLLVEQFLKARAMNSNRVKY